MMTFIGVGLVLAVVIEFVSAIASADKHDAGVK
jgi:hypothetical protein